MFYILLRNIGVIGRVPLGRRLTIAHLSSSWRNVLTVFADSRAGISTMTVWPHRHAESSVKLADKAPSCFNALFSVS